MVRNSRAVVFVLFAVACGPRSSDVGGLSAALDTERAAEHADELPDLNGFVLRYD